MGIVARILERLERKGQASGYAELDSGAHLPAARLGGILTTQGDIMIRDGSGPTRLGAGSAGRFLKTPGAGANPEWADAEEAVFEHDFFYSCFESPDGWYQGGDTGYGISFNTRSATMQTPNVLNSVCWLYASTGSGDARFKWTRNPKVTWMLAIDPSQFYRTYQEFRCRLGRDSASDTETHMGFKLVANDTEVRVYASNANGSAQTQTDTGVTLSGSQRVRLKAVRLAGEIRFYVDEVLKATHNTNLPTVDTYMYLYHHLKATEAQYKKMSLVQVLAREAWS